MNEDQKSSKMVYLQAVDWGIVERQINSEENFTYDVIHAELIGFLVCETDTSITITQQKFQNDSVRYTLTVPKICIINRHDFALDVVND